MAKKARVEVPVAPLPDLIKWWRSQRTSGLVIGGLAVALLGRPRVTRDIDGLVLLAENRWPDFIESGARFGFVPRHDDTVAFAHESRVLLLRHQPTNIDVDIAVGSLPFEDEAVARGCKVRVSRCRCRRPRISSS